MNDNHQEDFTKLKSNKTLETNTSKSKFEFIKKIINIFTFIHSIIKWVINKIHNILSGWTILTQTTIILMPFSLICIYLIFSLHYNFYKNLFIFNFQKGLKEELIDHYITEMDDLHAELDSFVVKENYFDIENQLFFAVYYKELSSIGLLKNSSKKTFPNINRHSDTMYSVLDNYLHKNGFSEDVFTISPKFAKAYVDDREGDSIGEFAKLYYYMLPIISYGAFQMKVFINQTFFIGYEFTINNNYRNISNNSLFFILPRGSNFNGENNFIPYNELLNPLVNNSHFVRTELINNSFYKENWFMKQDNLFRESVNDSHNGYSDISFAHLNHEYN